jgi:hypothetical protein
MQRVSDALSSRLDDFGRIYMCFFSQFSSIRNK